MLALPLPAAIWNIAFLIETNRLSNEQVQQFRSAVRIEEKIASLEEFEEVRDELYAINYGGAEPQRAVEMLFCYSVYFYLGYRGFYKAFNSMAKLLSNRTFCVYAPEFTLTTDELSDKYWAMSVRGGCISAVANVGNKQFREMETKGQYDQSSEHAEYTHELLEIAASMDFITANYNLANYYEFDAKHSEKPLADQQSIEKTYRRAIELDKHGDGLKGRLYYKMAVFTRDPAKKKSWYEKALAAGKNDAAYQLAMICVEKYEKQKQKYQLAKAKKYIDDYGSFFSAEWLPLAKILRDEIQRLIYGAEPAPSIQSDLESTEACETH